MKSVNFEFLREGAEELAALGGFAETYLHSDPQSAAVKLRTFMERVVDRIYSKYQLPKAPQSNNFELLRNPVFVEIVPGAVRMKLDAIRDHGNKAAHGDKVSEPTCAWLLREAWDLARWYFIAMLGGSEERCGQYQEPPAGGAEGESKARLKREKKAALEKAAAQEAQINALLKELEDARASSEKANAPQEMAFLSMRLSDRSETEGAATSSPSAERAEAARSAQAAADVLGLSEADTRKRLVDSLIAATAWNIGANGANTAEVTQEEEVLHQPTSTGIGYADYVLWDDDGTPLAVVEVKRTAKDPEEGRTQARLYADGLEKMHGKRPVIFYTNGFDIWIWDDAQGYPPRKLYGFYSKDSLQYLTYQRTAKQALDTVAPRKDIAGRLYQVESIKRMTERFALGHRKGLIVQATGTGKTRVAIALSELLIRAQWAKRILFLCDRRELRKQAKDAYNEYMNQPALTIVRASTAKERDKRIYIGTYPAMMKVFESFDAGFFDLIIADESHRSIYNIYGDLFKYFDCLQVGLTATPVEFVSRNTYSLFACENQDPTAYYPYDRAVAEGFLVPFRAQTFQTEFQRKGIKYDQLSEEQRQELEESGEDPQLFDYDAREMDKRVYNRDTGRHILRNLMENGIRDVTGQEVGKTIIFARNHLHAVELARTFDEMYPQYGGKFCQVIDNYDPRAEQLIDDFKNPKNELTIAISVDMLDTGIDVPEVVNLVFAKPVYSKVKFWQMIGRGTRLCADLFGPGQHKTEFLIFDHWGNFDYFDFHYQPIEPKTSKSLMQLLFEARIDLAEAALQAAEPDYFDHVCDLLLMDLNALPADSIAVREHWRAHRAVSKSEVLRQWDAVTVQTLRTEIAPLMRWCNIRGESEAYDFDLLVTRMQTERLRNSARFDDYKVKVLDKLHNLQMNVNQVKAKAARIKEARDGNWWAVASVAEIEEARTDLREIIHLQVRRSTVLDEPKKVDVTEDATRIETATRSSAIPEVEMKLYRQRAEEALRELAETDPTLRKIRKGEAVTPAELEALTSLVLTRHPGLDLATLAEFYDAAGALDQVIRGLVGMEPEAVRQHFEDFVAEYPSLTAKQTQFLSLLQNHIARFGSITVEKLYENPFTLVDSAGIDGVFDEAQGDRIVAIIETFKPAGSGKERTAQ